MQKISFYVLSLKDNHPRLHQQVKNWFEANLAQGFFGVDVSISQRVEKGHHRIENRQVYTVPLSPKKRRGRALLAGGASPDLEPWSGAEHGYVRGASVSDTLRERREAPPF